MTNFRVLLLALLLSSGWSSIVCRADEVYTFVVKKQEEKAKTRWSLEEWLKTRDRMRLMDLWLALHSPSPYEFYVGADTQWGSRDPLGKYNSWRFDAAAFASVAGLAVQHESSPYSETTALALFRIFGYHDQSTNITLQGGLRMRSEPASYRNAALGVGSTIYLGKSFGITGLYRHFLDSTPNATGAAVSGNRCELGAFIEFAFLRVYGSWFQESESQHTSAASQDSTRSGALAGARLYF